MLVWAVMAALGEPTVLRSFDTWLLHQAVGGAAAVVLVVLLLVGPAPTDPLARLGCHLLLLAATALAVGGTLLALDVAMGRMQERSSLQAAGLFLLAGLPWSVASASPRAPTNRHQVFINKVLMTISAACTVAVGVGASVRGLDGRAVLAVVACVVGGTVLVACSGSRAMMGTDHEDRNTR